MKTELTVMDNMRLEAARRKEEDGGKPDVTQYNEMCKDQKKYIGIPIVPIGTTNPNHVLN